MDDLGSKLSELLSSPDGMSKIMDVASQLGLGTNKGTESDAEKGTPSLPAASEGGEVPANLDVNLLMNMQRALSSMNKNDKNTELLRALKPHFSSERRGKVDEALRILQLVNMLPMLQESGLFGSLLGGDKK